MERIGLVAGGGVLPIEFIRSVRERGDDVIVFAVKNMASAELNNEVKKIYWMDIGQYTQFMFLLLTNRIKRLAFLGKIKKDVIFDKARYDEKSAKIMSRLKDKKDYSIMNEGARRLGMIGVEVIDTTAYLAHLLPERGVLGKVLPDEQVKSDIEFGYDIAKKIAGMDIGQTIVVKDTSVVAVEAMEGTDPTIERANGIAGKGCVMVKVSRPHQDMRWDIPTVGPETMKRLAENGYKALAIESGRMYLLEKNEFLKLADEAGIAVVVL